MTREDEIRERAEKWRLHASMQRRSGRGYMLADDLDEAASDAMHLLDRVAQLEELVLSQHAALSQDQDPEY